MRRLWFTHVFLSPDFHGTLDPFLGVNPPVLCHVRQMPQTQVVEVHQKPLRFFLGALGLIWLKGPHIEFGSIDDLAM